MIVKMKKLAVLCHQDDRHATVERLQSMGVLHVVDSVRPENEAIEKKHDRVEAAKQALLELELDPRAKATSSLPKDKRLSEVAGDAILETLALATKQQSLAHELEVAQKEFERITPLGDFDPKRIQTLVENGLHVRLIKDSVRSPATISGEADLFTIAESKTARYRLVVAQSEPTITDAVDIDVPEMSLTALKAHIDEVEHQHSLLGWKLAEMSIHRGIIERWLQTLQDELRFLEAEAGMAQHGEHVAYIKGYCPAEAIPGLEKRAAQNGLAILAEEPTPDDSVPTYIRRPAWVKPIKGVFDVIGIFPGYKEMDISSVFLIFFSIFFAMIIGDGGYGLLFLGLTAYARKKMPAAPSAPFTLMTLLSVCTIVWGVLTGNFFGIKDAPAALEKLQLGGVDGAFGIALLVAAWIFRKKVPSLSHRFSRLLYIIGVVVICWGGITGNLFGARFLPGFLEAAKSGWLADGDNVMRLCFLLGSVHLTIAHAWNALTIMNSTKAFAQLGWIMVTWSMYALACNMILYEALPFWFNAALIVGFLLVLLFMNTKREIKRELHTYFVLPLDVIGNFVDVVSYVRLYAVGMASLAIAMNFNEMALAKGITGPVSALGAALILFAGHGLNILLCVMGVLVHGVRLNTLEFSRHIGIQWSGHAFNPLHRKSQITETSP
jgi:V/A-type H+/Na+-transporting ATPase subunit I